MTRFLPVVLLLALLPAGAAAQSTQCDGDFHVVHTLGSLELNDVDLAAPNDGWAVGFDYRTNAAGDDLGRERPLAVHFDDGGFEKMTLPRDRERGYELQGVAAIAPDDVHAVGYSYGYPAPTNAIAYHWDGTAWTQLEVPSPGRTTWLRAISAIAPDDIWAVGDFSRRNDSGASLILHYDGTRWSRVPSPEPGAYTLLWDVDALSSTEAWAVGLVNRRNNREQPLALRWDGTEWKRHPIGLEFPKSWSLHGVDAVSSDDVVAVGASPDGALVLDYDGTNWSFGHFPATRGSEQLNDVVATSTHAWTVGQRFVLRPYETVIPLAGHRSGDEWRLVTWEGEDYGSFEAVTLDDAGAAWAVGETFDPEGPDSGDVIERACAQ